MSSNDRPDPPSPPILHRDEVGSTNDELAKLAAAGADDGTALAAVRQTSGRGRRGRSWQTLDGEQLLVSVLYRPTLELALLTGVTLDVGVAVAEVLEAHGLTPRLKWPNDIQLGGRKVGGVLCEIVEGPSVIVGLGLNVGAAHLPEDLAASATTLAAEGLARDGATLLMEVVSAIRAACRAYDQRGAPRVDAWRSRSASLGAKVRELTGAHAGRVGDVTGVEADGALLVRWEGAATSERFIAGDLEVLVQGSPT